MLKVVAIRAHNISSLRSHRVLVLLVLAPNVSKKKKKKLVIEVSCESF